MTLINKESRSALYGEVVVKANPSELAAELADWFASFVNEGKPPFNVALCGGSTPCAFYTLLGSAAYSTRIDWHKINLFWGDERLVAPDHPDSNYRMIAETLLVNARIPKAQIHPMPIEEDPSQAAQSYENLLHRVYGAKVLESERPLFSINFLGLGEDGHIASLLPEQPVLQEKSHWVAAVPQGRSNVRLTLTYPALNSSQITVFLVTGKQKADIVKRAFEGDLSIPAGGLSPQGKVIWFLDADAASALV